MGQGNENYSTSIFSVRHRKLFDSMKIHFNIIIQIYLNNVEEKYLERLAKMIFYV